MFFIYSGLIVGSIATYVWTFIIRYRYTSQVCAGDFILTDISVVSKDNDVILDNYLIGCGRLLKCFIVVESINIFCCGFASLIWIMVTPMSLTRLTTSVDQSWQEERNMLLSERLTIKLQMREQEAVVLEYDKKLKAK